jgi:N6-adenosine-specific RNA methylase IME4
MIDFPDKKYNIIYADPAWNYEQTHRRGSTKTHYQGMELEDIKSLPVPDISADNCVLFIWVTFPMLVEGLEVIESWGFKYRTLGFSWIKLNQQDSKPFIGTGYYTRANCEVCLIATKGQVAKLVKDHSVSSVIMTKITDHSSKPYQVRDNIVKLFGDLPRIELFARDKISGWDQWGNEVPLVNIVDFI